MLTKLQHSNSKNYGFNLLVGTYQQKIYWHIRKMVIDHEDAMINGNGGNQLTVDHLAIP